MNIRDIVNASIDAQLFGVRVAISILTSPLACSPAKSVQPETPESGWVTAEGITPEMLEQMSTATPDAGVQEDTSSSSYLPPPNKPTADCCTKPCEKHISLLLPRSTPGNTLPDFVQCVTDCSNASDPSKAAICIEEKNKAGKTDIAECYSK